MLLLLCNEQKIMKVININLFILGVLYPFIIYFLNKYLWVFFLFFSLLWFLKFIFLYNKKSVINIEDKQENKLIGSEFAKVFKSYSSFLNNKYISFIFFALFLFMFIIKFINIKYEILIYLYPAFIYIMFFTIFIYNIKEKSLIEYFAEIEHKLRKLPPLNYKEKKYTRKLTYIWSIFFILNAVICIILSLFKNKEYWLFYTGIAGYILTAMFFILERILRSFFMKFVK